MVTLFMWAGEAAWGGSGGVTLHLFPGNFTFQSKRWM